MIDSLGSAVLVWVWIGLAAGVPGDTGYEAKKVELDEPRWLHIDYCSLMIIGR